MTNTNKCSSADIINMLGPIVYSMHDQIETIEKVIDYLNKCEVDSRTEEM